MQIKYLQTSDLDLLEAAINELSSADGVTGIMMLASDHENLQNGRLNDLLQGAEVPIFGGIFPGLIFERRVRREGIVLVSCSQRISVGVLKDIQEKGESLESEMAGLYANFSGWAKSIFLFPDGLSGQIGQFMETLFMTLGLEYNYVGGGCGSLSMSQKPSVICNQGVLQDAVVIAATELDSGVGVGHGWTAMGALMKVTAASGNIIQELDYQPAFDVYSKALEETEGVVANPEDFFEVSKGYPFGIQKLDAEDVVRDPIAVNQGKHILCVGEVEKGDYVRILKGDPRSLLDAAGQAARYAVESKSSLPRNFAFFVDCISRVLYLDQEFQQEVDVVTEATGDLPLFGVLSLGEIANNRKEYLEFYNKTSVVACF
ncbi:MAG: FIST N-terminal domain-containing protein [Bacteroidales bacterium]